MPTDHAQVLGRDSGLAFILLRALRNASIQAYLPLIDLFLAGDLRVVRMERTA